MQLALGEARPQKRFAAGGRWHGFQAEGEGLLRQSIICGIAVIVVVVADSRSGLLRGVGHPREAGHGSGQQKKDFEKQWAVS